MTVVPMMTMVAVMCVLSSKRIRRVTAELLSAPERLSCRCKRVATERASASRRKRVGRHSRDGSSSGKRRSRLRLCARCVRTLQNDDRGADLDLVTHVELALVHAGAVHLRARLVAEIDERDLVRTCDLDDRVHARGQLVVNPEVTLRILTDLDDVLRHRLATKETVTLIEGECENRFCHFLGYLDALSRTLVLRQTRSGEK
jgi:hypothetical protein